VQAETATLRLPVGCTMPRAPWKIQSERDGKERELDILLKKSPHDLWNEDLEDLLQVHICGC
jgi:hypothetical protein